ncbi:MAG: peptidoglycan-binding domain-containing protein [Alphaproteobacteria bacterium]|nr:peptidoglycan-binding domain-containing protein [Alphaproteobacteria bacterium]
MKYKWLIYSLALLCLGVGFTARAESRRESYCQAQRSLQRLYLYQGSATCQADEATRIAIEKFQKLHGLIPSGVIDPTTEQKLQSEVNQLGTPARSSPVSPGEGDGGEMVPNAQPVAPLGAKQVSDAKILPPVGGGAAATAANNYGTDRLQSHWVSTIPVWLMVVMVGGVLLALALVIVFLLGSKNRDYFN